MTRSPKLETYLAARWQLDQCEPGEKQEKLRALEAVTTDLLKQHPSVSARELAAITGDAYKEYCRTRRAEAIQRLSRLR